MSSIDWCKVCERSAIRFEKKLASSKKKIIFTTKKMIYLTIVSELVVLCGFVHIY